MANLINGVTTLLLLSLVVVVVLLCNGFDDIIRHTTCYLERVREEHAMKFVRPGCHFFLPRLALHGIVSDATILYISAY
jgi:membrane protein required for beta-lactamase induction